MNYNISEMRELKIILIQRKYTIFLIQYFQAGFQ